MRSTCQRGGSSRERLKECEHILVKKKMLPNDTHAYACHGRQQGKDGQGRAKDESERGRGRSGGWRDGWQTPQAVFQDVQCCAELRLLEAVRSAAGPPLRLCFQGALKALPYACAFKAP